MHRCVRARQYREPAIALDDPTALQPTECVGMVRLHNVTFSYGGAAVLRECSLSLAPGRVAALVGHSGGGCVVVRARLGGCGSGERAWCTPGGARSVRV